ncbi:MAG: MarR family winged helix-turn-helix transcriptional regulator, partial [Bacteroidota bacterium]
MDSIKSLGELSMGSRLKRMSDMCMRTIQRAYDHYNIDFDPFLFPAFHFIATNGKTTNTALCEALQTTQPAVTQNINKLNEKKLIELVTDETDKRKKIISLSSKGIILQLHMKPLWQAMDQAVKKYTQLPAHSLLEHIDLFESAVKSGAFFNTIIDIMETKPKTKIIDFDPQYQQAFYDLNIEWLKTFFYVEELDKEVLSKPEKYILEPGGHIFFAIEDGEAVGTVALMKAKKGHYELTKM